MKSTARPMPRTTDTTLSDRDFSPLGDRVVFLTSGGPLYWIIANALVAEFGPIVVVQEDEEPKSVFLQRRLKKLGAVALVGQVAFGVLAKFIYKASGTKRKEILSSANADTDPPEHCALYRVPDVNSKECHAALQQVSPSVVIVVGTRIIKQQTLDCIEAPFINYHPGMTPKYRGMNGAYWTLANDDRDNLAVTVHLVDAGVDTGPILYQEHLEMPVGQNITTYHDYLAGCARSCVVKAARDALTGSLKPRPPTGDSRQWYHPTLWGYLWVGLTRGVW